MWRALEKLLVSKEVLALQDVRLGELEVRSVERQAVRNGYHVYLQAGKMLAVAGGRSGSLRAR